MTAPPPVELDLTEPAWDDLLRVARSGGPARDPAVAGLVGRAQGGEDEAVLTLRALDGPDLVRLVLEHSGRSALLSCSSDRVVARLPGDSTQRLVSLEIGQLPALLARLVGLRPGPPAAVGRRAVHPQDLRGEVHRRWWLSRRPDTHDAGAGVEVWDTDSGWWRAVPGALEPVDAVEVWATFSALYLGTDTETGSPWPPRP